MQKWVEEFALITPFEEHTDCGQHRTWFVSRHPGALEWARRQGIEANFHAVHLDLGKIEEGDQVIGTLPVHLVYEVNNKGASYQHLSLDIPSAWRGKQLDADALEKCNARLEGYRVESD